MSPTFAIRPLPFDPSFEQIPDDEPETIRELGEAIRLISETTYTDSGHATRGVHAKGHGLLHGEIEIFSNLPPELAVGAFAKAAVLPVIMRFSTNPGDILDDNVSTPRGLAVKIIGVEGERLPGTEGQVTQDFVMQNATAFTAPTPKAFLKNLKLLAKTTDKAHNAKRVLSAVLRGAESVIEAVGGESGKIKSLGGHPETNLLGETYNTVVPLLYGPYYCKISVVPVSADLVALTDAKVDLSGKPDGLREAVNAFFATHAAEWDVCVQLATDSEKMPVEDASTIWAEDLSPPVAVARIRVAPQPAWTEGHSTSSEDGLAFSPWHGLAAHRPIGGVNRSRKPVYELSAEFRGTRNGCPMHEPRSQER